MMMSCLLRVKIHALWVQRSELYYPVAFPSSQAVVKAFHDFKDPEINQGWPGLLIWPATGFSVRLCVMSLRCPLRPMWRDFCLPNMLVSALPALNQVDKVPCLAGGCTMYVEGLFHGRTSEVGDHLDMAASEAASSTTRVASTGCL